MSTNHTHLERRSAEMTGLERCKAAPLVAWPTLIVHVASLGMWGFAVFSGATGALPVWLGFLLSSFAAYLSFSVMHESAHCNVGRSVWLNAMVGRLSALPLAVPFAAFRYVHLTHHQYTNDHGKDPDGWSGRGPKLLLPLRWLTQDFYQYVVWLKAARHRPRREIVSALLNLGVIGLNIPMACATGHGFAVLLFWLLPGRLAKCILSYLFDYAPHRPYEFTRAEDQYRATHIVGGPLLTIPMVYQNYHLIHHLHPSIPFYRMGLAWRLRKDDLLAKGSRVVPLFGAVKESAPLPED